MVIGIPKEVKPHEYRVAVTPSGARELLASGHRVLCEEGLGQGSGFSDETYLASGADICQRDQLFREAELIVKVKEPVEEEYGLLRQGQALFTFLHLAPNRELLDILMDKGIAAFAYETLEDGGALPLLTPMSEIAGRMAPIIGSYFLQKFLGGRGVLSAGAVGVPPAHILILGAGVVGSNALRIAHALGSEVTVMNRGIERLRRIDTMYEGEVNTSPLSASNIESALRQADMAIGAVYLRGSRTPTLVTRDMIGLMKKGAVIVDVSIDQGGCFETSRPTTHDNPVYEEYGITHYAVSNMPGAFSRTSTLALTNATLPYIKRLAGQGTEKAIRDDMAIRSALNIYKGNVAHSGLADSTGLPLCSCS